MRYRVHGSKLHVHRCSDHGEVCDYFADHALPWMLGNRHEARAQLLVFRASIVERIAILMGTLGVVDTLLKRLDMLRTEAG
jgi:hypothetical protein